MAEEITIDRNTLRALGADTRIKILKKLGSKRNTQAELASELSLSQPAIKEHLESLLKAGLVERIESEHKWKYYQITEKGRAIIEPTSKKIWFILGISICALVASFASVWNKLLPAASQTSGGSFMIAQQQASTAAYVAENMGLVAEKAPSAAVQLTSNTSQNLPFSLPSWELLVILAALIAIAACLATILKKKKIAI